MPFRNVLAEIRTQVVVICGPTRYQQYLSCVHSAGRTRVINTVQSRVYSRSGFNGISLNYIVIMADVNEESKVERGEEEMGPR